MKSIQVLIDESLKASNVPRKRSGKFSPSSFGKCFRSQVWNRADVAKTDEPEERVLRVFKAGNLFHDFVEGVIIQNNPDIQKEVRVEEEDVLGFADLVNGEAVYDLKTVHSGAFHYMKKDISESKKPNILQVVYYAKMLKKPKASLVFISKDDLCLKEFVFIVNDRWIKEIEDELVLLRASWVEYPKVLPPAIPRAYKDSKGKSKECEYCSWKTLCIKTERERNDTKGK